MARVKKTKPTLESLLFVTPEQRLLRLLLSESTTAFSPRVLSSRLKGVRGLGGAEGINKILQQLHEIGMVQFLNNNREVSLFNDSQPIQLLKRLVALCELEDICELLVPISSKGILFGSRASGQARSDSDYDVFVVTDQETEVRNRVERHPLGRRIEIVALPENDYIHLDERDPEMARKLENGIQLWGSGW